MTGLGTLGGDRQPRASVPLQQRYDHQPARASFAGSFGYEADVINNGQNVANATGTTIGRTQALLLTRAEDRSHCEYSHRSPRG
jgi:hypothetical protein